MLATSQDVINNMLNHLPQKLQLIGRSPCTSPC